MRTCRRAVTVLALTLPLFAWGAAPVVDNNSGSGSSNSYPPAGYGTSGAYAGGGVSAPPSAQGQLFMQLQQMQDEIARLRGMVEVQQNDIQRMKQEALERYQDLETLPDYPAGVAKFLKRVSRVRIERLLYRIL